MRKRFLEANSTKYYFKNLPFGTLTSVEAGTIKWQESAIPKPLWLDASFLGQIIVPNQTLPPEPRPRNN